MPRVLTHGYATFLAVLIVIHAAVNALIIIDAVEDVRTVVTQAAATTGDQ